MSWYSTDMNGNASPFGGSSVDDGQVIQVSELPVAGADELNHIYQYVGDTTSSLTNGYFYKCVYENAAYSWTAIAVQEGGGGTGGQTIQYTELPTASASEAGHIYQYVGVTTASYTNGYFYKCINDNSTYIWVRTDIQPETTVATENAVGTVKPDGETIIIDPDGTIHALGGGGGIHLSNVSGAEATSIKETVYLKWSDPSDVVVSGITLAEWGGTKVLRKVDSAPTGIDDEDATVILDSKTRNAYSSTPLEDNTVEYGVQYYYKFFPYTVDDVVTNGSAVGIVPHRVVINTVPSQSGKLEYDGEVQSPTWSNYNTDELTLGGTTSGTAVGTYTATFTPKSDYMWSDGTQNAVDVTWAISNIAIAAVPTQDGTLSYTGESQSPTWNGYDTDALTISGDTSGTAIDTYTAVFTPKTNYEWWDGTTTGKDAEWSISEAVITTVPTQQGTLTYDGTLQTAVWNNFDQNELTVTGNTGTDAGTYTASFTPNSGYKWSDGTTITKTASWVIDKAAGSVTLSSNSVTLDESHLTATVTASNATGEITVTSSDATIATASYSNGVITISSTQKAGSVSITVSIAASANYNATTSSITVTGDFLVVKDWKDGNNQATDAELASMLAAADAGTLDLSLYWAIGDERTVHLDAITADPSINGIVADIPAIDHTYVLMNEGYNGQTGINYVIGQKNMPPQYCMKMNTANTNVGSWGATELRAALNSLYYNAFPSTFKTLLKEFDVITASEYNSTTLQTVKDKLSLFAGKEVFGTISSYDYYWTAVENNALEQIEYYKTSSNRTKYSYKSTNHDFTSNVQWTLRTPFRSNGGANAQSFLAVSGGNVEKYDAWNSYQSAPFGCI